MGSVLGLEVVLDLEEARLVVVLCLVAFHLVVDHDSMEARLNLEEAFSVRQEVVVLLVVDHAFLMVVPNLEAVLLA